MELIDIKLGISCTIQDTKSKTETGTGWNTHRNHIHKRRFPRIL